ncbi:MAG: hypothetical protein WBD40_05735 [Tepidisphaeraceae bacterium]
MTRATIEDWIDLFDDHDRDLAARVLDVVEFYGQAQIHAAYRQALGSLRDWNATKSKRSGQWRFAAMSGSAGESGDSMLYQFRVANNLDGSRFSDLFIARRDFVREKLGPQDTVVLLDDFSGTGKQVCDAWSNPQTAFGELLAGVGRVYLVLVAATRQAKKRISNETSLSVLPAHDLDDRDNIFSNDCAHFTANDRKRLLHYCTRASEATPLGFGECGLVVVFQHRTPNNTIPILHAVHADWSGLFPRHD